MTPLYTNTVPTAPGWYHAIPWEFSSDDDAPMPVFLETDGNWRRVWVSGKAGHVDNIAVWGPRIDPPGEPDDWRAAIERAVEA